MKSVRKTHLGLQDVPGTKKQLGDLKPRVVWAIHNEDLEDQNEEPCWFGHGLEAGRGDSLQD